jgi:hypothetical protein
MELEYGRIQHRVGEALLRDQKLSPRPTGLNYDFKTPRDFQQQALGFMAAREKMGLQAVIGGALCSPTGTGKTFIAIMLCAQNLLDVHTCVDKPYLPINVVVCPSIIKKHWFSEISQVWPGANVFDFSRVKQSGVFTDMATKKKQSIASLPRNSFVLVAWECLSKELNYACATRCATPVFALSDYCYGRIIFDEAQFSGTVNCAKFKMCCDYLRSVFRWYQSATPANSKHGVESLKRLTSLFNIKISNWSDEDEVVRTLSQVMWCHTRKQVESQMELPSVTSIPMPIAFSLVEREYYNLATLCPTQKRDFCKGYTTNETIMRTSLVEALRHELEQLQEAKANYLYDLALHLYFVQLEPQMAANALYDALDICQNKMHAHLAGCGLLLLDTLKFKILTNKIITTLGFMDSKLVHEYANLKECNERAYLSLDVGSIWNCNMEKKIPEHYRMFRAMVSRCSDEDAIVLEVLMALWLDYRDPECETDELHARMSSLLDNPDRGSLDWKLDKVLSHWKRKLTSRGLSDQQRLHLLEYCRMQELKTDPSAAWLKTWKHLKMDDVDKANCHAKYQEAEQLRLDGFNAKICLSQIELVRKLEDAIDVEHSNFLSNASVQIAKKLRRLKNDSSLVILPIQDPQLDATIDKKLQHFGNTVPYLCASCLICEESFCRERYPIHFSSCNHDVCDKCDQARIEKCPECKGVCELAAYGLPAKCYECESFVKACHSWVCGTMRCEDCVAKKCATCSECETIAGGRLSTRCRFIAAPDGNVCEAPAGLVWSDEFQSPPQYRPTKSRNVWNGSKLDAISKLIQSLLRGQPERRKILIFDTDTEFLKQLKFRTMISGTAETFHLENDSKVIDQFIGCGCSCVLFLHLEKTAGLHLVAADSVILCTPCDDPSVEMQAVQRAHRFGQMRPVSVYHCYMQDSVEQDCFMLSQERAKGLEDANSLALAPVAEVKVEYSTPVQAMLKELRMEEFIKNFEADRYELLVDLLDLSHDDLDRLTVPRGRRGRIFGFLDSKSIKRQRLQ